MRATRLAARLAFGSGAAALGIALQTTAELDERPKTIRKLLTSVAHNVHVDGWSSAGVAAGHAWSVTKRTLHGGRQEGVDVIEVNNGVLKFTVVPTRGMSIGTLDVGDPAGNTKPLGWASPVRETVHPKYVDRQDFQGLGWLTAFNEWCVRCGVAFAGHPAQDASGHLLTLHGRIGNIPASEVEVLVDEEAPHRIRVRGRVDEAMFKFCDFELWTEVSTVPGSGQLQIRDELINRSSYQKEYQMIYHTNFGPPLLEKGAKFVAPVETVMPFNSFAAAEMARAPWQLYSGPTRGYGETVYNVTNYAVEDDPGAPQTLVMLANQAGDAGVSLRYGTRSLPCFALWKNTDTIEEGYVTGLEPSTGFPYPRQVEAKAGRVPMLGPGESVTFDLEWTVLRSQAAVDATRKEIERISAGRAPRYVNRPEGR